VYFWYFVFLFVCFIVTSTVTTSVSRTISKYGGLLVENRNFSYPHLFGVCVNSAPL